MTKRLYYVGLLLALAALLAGAVWYPLRGGTGAIEGYVSAQRPPHIRPDYADTVIPPNIAPLNFCVAEPGVEYHVKIHSMRGEPI
ncbi:MAG: hypothetical protein KAX44_08785, partial [Candidatus Brocadiae bacterium]|nr:hypothetical protein [Candidatus Brocadiia bacterium]